MCPTGSLSSRRLALLRRPAFIWILSSCSRGRENPVCQPQSPNCLPGLLPLPWLPGHPSWTDGEQEELHGIRRPLLNLLRRQDLYLLAACLGIGAACLGKAAWLSRQAGGESVPSCGCLLGNPLQVDFPEQAHMMYTELRGHGEA